MYISGYHSSKLVRLLHSFFVQLPIQVWFRFVTAYLPSKVQFVNHTSLPYLELMRQWSIAQQGLATAPFPMDTGGGGMHPADPRALTVQPRGVTVVSVPDVPVADLVKLDPLWAKQPTPSGVILISISGIMDYTPCHAVTFTWHKPRVYAAAGAIPDVLSYEFQNIILSRLGYNVENR